MTSATDLALVAGPAGVVVLAAALAGGGVAGGAESAQGVAVARLTVSRGRVPEVVGLAALAVPALGVTSAVQALARAPVARHAAAHARLTPATRHLRLAEITVITAGTNIIYIYTPSRIRIVFDILIYKINIL